MFYDINQLTEANPIFLVAWPVGLSILAFIIWYLGYRAEVNGKKAPWKWLAILIMAAALAIGISALRMIFSGDYDIISDQLPRRIRYALYGASGVPILGLLSVIGLSVFQRLNNAQRF